MRFDVVLSSGWTLENNLNDKLNENPFTTQSHIAVFSDMRGKEIALDKIKS